MMLNVVTHVRQHQQIERARTDRARPIERDADGLGDRSRLGGRVPPRELQGIRRLISEGDRRPSARSLHPRYA